jgi:hypothetical protein
MNSKSLISVWNHTQQHKSTSGARVCAAVLLGLYNGARFPMDLTELRVLDPDLRDHCFKVIYSDAKHCQREVHEWLNCISGRRDLGTRFEELAWEYQCFKRGRCKASDLSIGKMSPLIIDYPLINGKDMIDDELFVAEVKRAASLMTGVTIVEDASVPPGELRVVQDGKVTGAARFDIDAHHRAESTPFFNDLAG